MLVSHITRDLNNPAPDKSVLIQYAQPNEVITSTCEDCNLTLEMVRKVVRFDFRESAVPLNIFGVPGVTCPSCEEDLYPPKVSDRIQELYMRIRGGLDFKEWQNTR
jgi:hypothetical protein